MRIALLAAAAVFATAGLSQAQWVTTYRPVVVAPSVWAPAPAVWAPAPVTVTAFSPVVAAPVVVAPPVVAPRAVYRTRYRPFRPFAGPVTRVRYGW
ncbi:hypothetical protein Pla175_11070 [Pirellulimonas nuda]|uniref:Uncharacterized protein n=1 Tax=Pirellulimonas nuda TaxID=2528009 RepID=A0A518D8C9_9BACT|nr:hypothetical protein [Pirellulimonas nuda]QDU87741.1 hypothetical protein Pla175_11070 [Pirellulimonas nuda]